jgi:signal transduction histidine kinase/HAMP domain-containing protein/ActR/RegA family two-component response regulator
MNDERHQAADDAFLVRLLAAMADLRDGNFKRRLAVPNHPLNSQLAQAFNEIADRNQGFVGELANVREGLRTAEHLTGRLVGEVGPGGWATAAGLVNGLLEDLAPPITELSRVLGAVAKGDLTQRMTASYDRLPSAEIGGLAATVNGLLEQLARFADEVTRVAREVGGEGRLGGQAMVPGAAGTWRALTDSVNFMAGNLTSQVRNIAQVATAVAAGDLTQQITVDVKGEMLELKNTVNTMVDRLSAFASEVTRVAREVGTEGKLGGQAHVRGVAGTWKDLTENVNNMAGNLTSQVRNIAQVTTAVAQGDLSKKIDVDARGEILELKTTINTMVDQLSAFASEVTRVAREVGTEGKLGGQAEVIGVSGTWQRLTESVNRLAGNLTTQVRAIAAVATAVTAGDLTRQISLAAAGEVAELKDNINQMIANLRATTKANQEQDWLKTNLARLSGRMQGTRDLAAVASLVMSELTPLVSAQHGAFYLISDEDEPVFELVASYAYRPRDDAPVRFRLGEGLIGQVAVDKRSIVVSGAPAEHIAIVSGLGASRPGTLILLPVLFENQVLGVIELASITSFTPVHLDLLEQLREMIGTTVNTILVLSRTDTLLAESQRLAGELQTRQDELQQSNTDLADKAQLLAQTSKYKSEFMANMSHELRTPLNSLLVLAKLLSDNQTGNLTDKQVQFATTIHSAGFDLLQLINDILDKAKVESGRLQLEVAPMPMAGLVGYVEALCRPLTVEKQLDFMVRVAPDVPAVLHTDEQRLQQVLRNLLSNAVKFTSDGSVELEVRLAGPEEVRAPQLARAPDRVAFAVRDTGIGIPQDKLAVIFEAFQQADGTTSRKYGGTGLGLSICRELADLLGGELVVSSTPGKGSTFTLYLPVRQITPPSFSGPSIVGIPRALSAAGSVAAPRFHGERVLIVDDDMRNVLALTAALEAQGLRVVSADNGVAGVRELEQHEDVSVVLMDIMMPELDGNATIAAIRSMSAYADLPVIAVTAKAMKEDRDRSLASGATDYVTKPVDLDHLLALLDRYVRAGHLAGPVEINQ